MTIVEATPLARETSETRDSNTWPWLMRVLILSHTLESRAARMKPRMLVVFGSQTGTCKRLATKMAERWKSRGICESMECVEGNELAQRWMSSAR